MCGERAGKSGAERRRSLGAAGFTLVELSVSMVVISILVVSLFGLFITLVHSATIARQRAVALALATNQMEYLKSLPYDNLVVIGGSIGGTAYIPASTAKVVNGGHYTVKTAIDYVDDAYDNCGNIYPSAAVKVALCRGATASTPTTDTSFYDYKIAHVTVVNSGGTQLATVDTEIAARVSETSSNTGAFIVTVTDASGTPISGATVNVTNNVLSPTVNLSDTTDANGLAIFYKVTPDASNDYVVTAAKSGYSSLGTIGVNGSLQPNYANQKVINQQASSVTLKLAPMVPNSLVVETTDTSGNPLGNAKVYIKGGYKQYTSTSDYSYYYDNYYAVSGGAVNYGGTVSDNRLLTDASGLNAISNLAPINGYTFCNSDNAGAVSNCSVGGSTYYLAAALPYAGTNSLGPISVPINDPNNPPAASYAYGSTQYVQKVRLMLTSSSSFPRVYTMSPSQVSLSSGSLGSTLITFTGYNLGSASATLTENGTSYTGTGCTSSTTQLKCTFNLSSMTAGTASVSISNSSGTLTLPTTPLGGFNVTQ